MLESRSAEKIGKTSKNCCFWAQVEPTSSHLRSRPKWKTFFIRNNKSRSLAFTFRIFLFYQNIRCFGWVRNPFLFCSVFCPWLKKHENLSKPQTHYGSYILLEGEDLPFWKRIHLPVSEESSTFQETQNLNCCCAYQ